MHVFVAWNRPFLRPCDLGSPQFWTIKLYAAIDIHHTISLMWRHFNGKLEILFIVCHQMLFILTKKQRNSKSIDNLSKTFFRVIPKSISKFPKSLKNSKTENFFLKSCLFVTLPSDSLLFQKELMTKSDMRFGFKPLGNHSIYQKNN